MSTDISRLITEEKATSVKRVKTLTSYVNNIGIAVCLWLFIYPYPYDIALTIGVLFPFLVLFMCYKNRNVITLQDDDDKKVAPKQPSLLTALTLPPMGLFVRVLIDYDLLIFNTCLVAWAVIFIILSLIVLVIQKGSVYKIRLFSKDVFGLILFVVIFSYGSCITINCLYDYSVPNVYHTTVLDKHISGGKHTSYYLKLDKWGPRNEPKDVSVSKSLYAEAVVDSRVYVKVKKGLLKAPWFYITK